ncbi:C-type lectin [Rhodopirellula baltica SWK14]|uniref:C-type lectin n=1 Tax=Rhodopirellula baltica SWK14 TaxID=993516 RepID=L7C853_RHOBT|nr:C-type lectin [Rhodopirellula baltica SWK14]
MESRWMLAADAISDMPESTPLVFAPVVEGRDLQIARSTGDLRQTSNRFSLSTEEQTELSLYVNSGGLALTFSATLFDEDGNYVTKSDPYSPQDYKSILVPEAGEYLLEVDSSFSSDYASDYQLRVLQGSLPFETESLAPLLSDLQGIGTASVAGVIASGLHDEDIDSYSLGVLAAGTRVDLTASIPSGGTAAPIIELRGPRGIVVDQNPARGKVEAVVPSPGTYEIRVRQETVFGDSRYQFQGWNRKTEADQLAHDSGGHLLAINSAEEQTLFEPIDSETWIGISLDEHESVDSLRWSSGEELTYTNWQEGEPALYSYESRGDGFMDQSGEWALREVSPHSGRSTIIELPRNEDDPVSSFAGPDALYLLDVVVTDADAPQVASVSGIPTHDIVADSPLIELGFEFSEPVQATGDLNHIVDLREAGVDGEFFTDDDRLFHTTSKLDSPTELVVCIMDGPIADGHYQISISDQLTDLFGNPLAAGAGYSKSFEIAIDAERFVFEGVDNDTIETATPIPLTPDSGGTGLSHTTRTGLGLNSHYGDQDYWTFDVAAASEITVRILGNGRGLSLLDADENVLASDSSVIDAASLPKAGQYFVRISGSRGSDANAPYQLSFDVSESIAMETDSRQSNINPTTEDIEFNETTNPRLAKVTGALAFGSDSPQDRFSLGTLNAGSTVSLRSILPHWSTLKPFVELYRGYERVLDINVSEEVFEGTIAVDGSYYAVVRADIGYGLHGQYILDIEINDDIAPKLLGTPGLPAADEVGDGLIGRFELNFSEDISLENDLIDLREAGADGQFDTDDDRPFHVELTSDGISSYFDVIVTDGPLDTGQFRLKLNADITDLSGNTLDGDNAVTQFFRLDAVDSTEIFEGFDNDQRDRATVLPLELDPTGTGFSRTPRSGVGLVATLSDTDWWKFEAEALQTARVSLTTEMIETMDLTITDSVGNSIGVERSTHPQGDKSTMVNRFRVPRDGEYYIQIQKRFLISSEYQRDYELRVDTLAGPEMESREQANHFKGYGDTIALNSTPNGSLKGSIAGTLLLADRDTYKLGSLEPNVQVRFTIDRPQWSQVEPVIGLYGVDSTFTEISPDEDGSFRALTTDRGGYEVLVAANPEGNGAGFDGQYVLNVEVIDTVPFQVTEIRGLPSDNGETDQMLSEFEVTFNRNLSEGSFESSEVFIMEAGADGVFGTSDDQSYALKHEFAFAHGKTQYDRLHFSVESGVNVLCEGNYRLHLPASFQSRYGEPLEEGDGYSTDFSIDELPEGYLFEGPANDDRTGAVHLDPEAPGSNWLVRGIGSLERDDDIDFWSIDASAGDWVTVWTPNRSSSYFTTSGLSNEAGQYMTASSRHHQYPQQGAFQHYVIPTDGEYFVAVEGNTAQLPNDRLYELWVHIAPLADGEAPIEGFHFNHPIFQKTDHGETAVVANSFISDESGSFYPYDETTYDIGHLPEHTDVRIDTRSTTWTFANSFLLLDPIANRKSQRFVATGTITDQPGTELTVGPSNRYPGHVPNSQQRADYIVEIQSFDVTAPKISLDIETDSDTHYVRASASDSDELGRQGSGVAQLSLFSIHDGLLSHRQAGTTNRIEHTITSAHASHFFATATDRVGNRSILDLSDQDLGPISIDSAIADNSLVTWPSQIVVGSGTSLTWSGQWDVLLPIVRDNRLYHRVTAGDQVIEFEGMAENQNPVLAYDVDRSGSVSAIDALLVINHLNSEQAQTGTWLSLGGLYFDVNGDSRFSPLDALQIINQLRFGPTSGESEFVPIEQTAPQTFICRFAPSDNSNDTIHSTNDTAIPHRSLYQFIDATPAVPASQSLSELGTSTRDEPRMPLDPTTVDEVLTSSISSDLKHLV